jgi:hypothetical protein
MAEKCYAPIFKGNGFFACFILAIVYALAIAAIILLTFGLCLLFASCRCTIKQYQYRIAHCREGNNEQNAPI